MPTFKQIVLLILDGFGVASPSEGNAITSQPTPRLDELINNYPVVTLQASGPTVGLPWGERGNSEVGHLNLGAGRIVSQYLLRIASSIGTGEFFENQILIETMEHAKHNGTRLHLIGLVSNGGVHSSEEHLFALLAMAKDQGVDNVYIHMFADGRDTPPKAALESLTRLNRKIAESGVGKIATIAGRFYGMDRGGHWDLTEKSYQAIVGGKGEQGMDPEQVVKDYYENQITDETFPPTVITTEAGEPVARVEDKDAVIFFNFRPDRMVQIASAFLLPKFDKFQRAELQNVMYATMTEYEKELGERTVFPPIKIKNGLSEVVSEQGWKQYHIAETEKYAHVTSFFNGGWEDPWPGEERDIVTSPESYKNRYADVPEMSSGAITDKIIEQLNADTPFILANFANADMVGHTGNKQSCLQAVAAIDANIGKIAKAAEERGAAFVITADHGNIEQVIDPISGMIDKEHSTNPVPLIVIGPGLKLSKPRPTGYASLAALVPEGVLSDVSPTILELFGLSKAPEMTAISLVSVLLKQLR